MDFLPTILLIIVLILAAALLLLFAALATYVAHPRRYTPENSRSMEIESGMWGNFDSLNAVSYLISSYDGYLLHAQFVAAPADSNRYVILSHGYTGTRFFSIKYLHLFRSLGYNCVIYDNRGHGENKRTGCTLGMRESKDLIAVISDTYSRYGNGIFLGLHGESMGSGLQITALRYHPNVKFIINDCGYADLVSVLRHKVKHDFGLPRWVVYPASFMSRLLYGYSFTSVRPIDSLADNQVPICFVHGTGDRFIDCEHSRRMYAATKGYAELHLFEDARHAGCLKADPERYFKMLSEFLAKVD